MLSNEPSEEIIEKVRKKQKEREALSATDKVKRETRLRVWAGIFYPESTKSDWQRILQENMIPAAISPLHDRDKYIDGDNKGELKKPHYHIVFRFSSVKSYSQVWDILKLIAVDPAHCPPPERPYSDIDRLCQYLVHRNDPDKAQYSTNDITTTGGFDVNRYFRLTGEVERQVFESVFSFIDDRNINEYWVLLQILIAMAPDDPGAVDMLQYTRSHTIQIVAMLNSRRNYLKNGGKK